MIRTLYNNVKRIPARAIKLRISSFFYLMLIFVPASLFFGYFAQTPVLTFVCSVLALIPLAQIIGHATKQITIQTNPKVGGLLSATFGNAIELIITVLALRKGLVQVVQASIIGSIVGNILLLIGLSVFFGGLAHKHQRFNKEAIGVSSTMLIIAIVGLTIPTMYGFTMFHTRGDVSIQTLSNAVAIVLALIYVAGLVFSLRTHRDLFDASDDLRAHNTISSMSKPMASLIIFVSTLIVALVSEAMVHSFSAAAQSVGLSAAFIGIVVISIITNVAEYSIAIQFAKEDNLDVSFQIGLSSATQIALFVVPILAFLSSIWHWGFSLVFAPFEVISVILAVMIINHLAADGRCNWLEGAQLISVYLIIAIAFFFVS